MWRGNRKTKSTNFFFLMEGGNTYGSQKQNIKLSLQKKEKGLFNLLDSSTQKVTVPSGFIGNGEGEQECRDFFPRPRPVKNDGQVFLAGPSGVWKHQHLQKFICSQPRWGGKSTVTCGTGKNINPMV